MVLKTATPPELFFGRPCTWGRTKTKELSIETNQSDLLNTEVGLYEIVVARRWKKMLIRWVLGAVFFVALWHLKWVRVLFWISLPLELLLLLITLIVYYKLRPQAPESTVPPVTIIEEEKNEILS